MNVKFSNQNLLFKINEHELEGLLKKEKIATQVDFGSSNFICEICPQNHIEEAAVGLCLDRSESYLYLNLPMTDIQKLSDLGRNREGIYLSPAGLHIIVQVDIRTDKRSKQQGL